MPVVVYMLSMLTVVPKGWRHACYHSMRQNKLKQTLQLTNDHDREGHARNPRNITPFLQFGANIVRKTGLLDVLGLSASHP